MASIAPPCHTRGAKTTDSWITPRWVIEAIGPFDLDPCACIPQPWPCANRQFTEQDDGLMRPWDGFVYCNPPYGRQLERWLNRMALHDNGIAMIFARTETRAFFKFVWPHASCLLFLRGRTTFHRPDGTTNNNTNSGGPSVLVGYGELARQRLASASHLGALVTTQKEPPCDS